jgi:hypothetical protein
MCTGGASDMDDHRPQIDVPRFSVTPGEQTGKRAGGRARSPAWNREQLIRQFQEIDGSTRGEAERQIDAFERSFSTVFGDASILGTLRSGAKE